MSLPPLLQEHIRYLEDEGHKIEVTVNSEIHIVIKDYKISDKIWNRTSIDLLIITHPTYPNAKMDMFWVDPPISLKNGKVAQASDTIENKIGKNWQRFSWHVKLWNPGQDNLITYLNVVDDRLRREE